jgi:hypothetical protein
MNGKCFSCSGEIVRKLARSLRSLLPLFLGHKMFALLILTEDSFVSDFLAEPPERSFQVSVNLYFCHVVLIHPFIAGYENLPNNERLLHIQNAQRLSACLEEGPLIPMVLILSSNGKAILAKPDAGCCCRFSARTFRPDGHKKR